MPRTKTLNNNADTVVVTPARRGRKKPVRQDQTITNGVVCYYDAGVLLVAPLDESTAGGGSRQRKTQKRVS